MCVQSDLLPIRCSCKSSHGKQLDCADVCVHEHSILILALVPVSQLLSLTDNVILMMPCGIFWQKALSSGCHKGLAGIGENVVCLILW